MNKLIRHKFVFLLILLVSIIILSFKTEGKHNNTRKLIEAIEEEEVNTVRTLLEKDVDPNKMDVSPSLFWSFLETSPRRPLSVACETGNLKIVKLLIEYGATAESREGAGFSPLRETLFYYQPEDVEIVKILLENGASKDDDSDEIPMFIAAQMYPRTYDESKKNGTVFEDEYNEEVAKGITEIVKILLNGNSINETTESGKTLLILSVEKENVYLAQYLISVGSDIEAKEKLLKTIELWIK